MSKRHAKLRNDFKKLQRIIEFLENEGDRYYKLKTLKNSLYTKFRNERSSLASFHDWHLELWANEINQEICVPNFRAGATFVLNFKREFKISSRKITKFYTKSSHINEEKIKEVNFAVTVSTYIQQNAIAPYKIWNTDQSGFAYELISARTLTNVGEKDELGLAQNMNSLSHSYTIQVHISAAAKLGSKLFVCFQEPKGFFGPKVSEKLKKPPKNIFVTCTKSGKMTKDKLNVWAKECFSLDTSGSTLLILDSWPAQKNQGIYSSREKLVKLFIIPPKETKYGQPLDVYFFRQLRLFAKRISDYVRSSD